MARDIDRLIEYIRNEVDYIPPVYCEVIVRRIEGKGPPDQTEINQARAAMEGKAR